MKKSLLLICFSVALFTVAFRCQPVSCLKGDAGFEPPVALGTIFNTLGGIIPSSGNGLIVKLGTLAVPSGQLNFNQSKVQKPPFPFGSGQTLRMNNTTLDFSLLPGTQRAEVEYLDQGSTINVGAGGNAQLYIGNMSSMPANMTINGVTIYKSNVVPILNANGTKVAEKGTLIFKHPTDIGKIIIGGQELSLDNFCFK